MRERGKGILEGVVLSLIVAALLYKPRKTVTVTTYVDGKVFTTLDSKPVNQFHA